MDARTDIVEIEVDKLYRDQFGKMLSSLLRFSDDLDLEAAEDIVQDTFSAALVSWRKDGLPVNPVGWLYKVSRNRALNKIKESKKFRKSLGEAGVDGVAGEDGIGGLDGMAGEDGVGSFDGIVGEDGVAGLDRIVGEDGVGSFDGMVGEDGVAGVERNERGAPIEDEQLILLFACAHPDLAPKVQVGITLKYVVNLKVEAIARILGLTIDGIDKMLSRARQKIRDERILFHEPSASSLRPRVQSVHKILYLIFNEGYKSSWGKELIREELCEEALIMTRALCRSVVGDPETHALYALMLFNAARIKARFGRDGELLDLEEQDRTLWDPDLIRLAMVNLESAYGGGVSTYYCEAAIAGLHCAAETYGATNWNAIIRIYRQLLGLQANPFVELNYAIALYYSGDKVRALGILHELEKQAFLGRYYLLHASLGRIYAAEGNKGLAKEYLETTLRLTNAPDEIAFVRRLIKKVE